MGTTRMNATDRRELVLAAAARAFARGGYAGTSTDAVAKEAGVSQPYVVRMFGTKVELFQAVFAKTVEAIVEVFEAELAGIPNFDPLDESHWERLGQAYGELFQDRDLLMVMLHGFVQGNDPAIGAQSRDAMARIYTLLREGTGAEPELVRDFVAKGMLINILIAMGAPEHAHEGTPLGELSTCSFGEKLATMRLAVADTVR